MAASDEEVDRKSFAKIFREGKCRGDLQLLDKSGTVSEYFERLLTLASEVVTAECACCIVCAAGFLRSLQREV